MPKYNFVAAAKNVAIEPRCWREASCSTSRTTFQPSARSARLPIQRRVVHVNLSLHRVAASDIELSISMPDDWSREEVEIIVENYLGMLLHEIRGEDYNKAERNRALRELIPKRSRGSIEFKHANISAVMIELGYPYVDGYKPRSNFQGLLCEVVERRVYGMTDLAKAVAAVVEQPAAKPAGIHDLLAIQVAPPAQARKRSDIVSEDPPRVRVATRRNYLELEVRNQSLGNAGEELALEFEHERLWRSGHKHLAERIEHVSDSKGDGLGFDILSFETDGRERLVEVKTTRFGAMTPFFASKNEVETSDERASEYHVYRLFDFGRSTRLFMLQGSIRQSCELEAIQFRASTAPTDAAP